ncbi:MAG TPA: hypothetical protein VJG67_03660 [Candidatus Paceibacterota bacterium]|uniref:Uncharacterized protein n=1 Tax=Candidatus Zambryskibacteria bacterium RIFCSPLOWO2_01_FULL_35_19 TaxID=1802757 RepID=A0A1G2TZC9_9BACT|nr:MAG: hypothetical protein A3A90_01715 [Candidatus Zambryskibacteria bacterium RIFCSPLOWO2_01_FULL_35_19]
MFGNRFEKEFKMIEKALETEQGEKLFRKYITIYVEQVVDKYINDNKIENILREKLIEAGWTHFSLALKKYKERTDLMLQGKNDIFYFNSYFNWYIRQGILEYINLIKNKI